MSPNGTAPLAAALDATDSAADAATVYWDPANEVTLAPALVARVIAWGTELHK